MSEKLGALIKEARNKKGLSQAALAAQVDGLTMADVGKIERGEKEPGQALLKEMAKALGVTQKSLLDAAGGQSASSGKTTSAKTSSAKTSSAKTSAKTSTAKTSTAKTSTAKTSTAKTSSSKTSSAKTSSAKISSSKTASTDLKLTAAEKKLVQLYRKADADLKKTAVSLLEGKATAGDLIGAMFSAKTGSSSSSKPSSSSGTSDLISQLLGGKTSGSSSKKDDSPLSALLEAALGKTGSK